jgi:hypothetical protein
MAAEEWGTRPWKIAGGSSVIWYFRWLEYHNLRVKRLEREVNARKR